MRTSFLLTCPLLVILACGGALSPVDPTTFPLEGSYDLSVATVDLLPTQYEPSPPNTFHPAVGGHARVDIRKVNGSYEAAITVDFHDAAPASVTATSDGTITLTSQGGGVSFSGGSNGYQNVYDTLGVIQLHVQGDGKIGGAWSATGGEMVSEGDVGWQADLKSTGTIGVDARPPQLTASLETPSQSGSPLPWDAILVRVSEPIDGAQLLGNVSLNATASGALATTWSLQPSQPDWVGVTQLAGYRTDWSKNGGATVNVAAGLDDPSGNPSTALASPTSFLDVPLAAGFDASASLPAQWGPVAVQSGATSCGGAATCLEIGPVTGPCQGPSAGGIAGRLATNGHTTLSMTYRVRAASQYGQPSLPSPFGLVLATPGIPTQQAPNPLSPPLSATSDIDYPYASDWITVTEPLPANAPEVGFAFAPFDQRGAGYCEGGFMPAPVTLVVDVVEVRLE